MSNKNEEPQQKFLQSSEWEKENSLSCRINDLENYYADSVLSENMKELYAEVQNNCEDFRYGVLFKNLDMIEEKLGNMQSKGSKMTVKEQERKHQNMMNDIKSPEQLLIKFSQIEN